jgi:phospholipase C
MPVTSTSLSRWSGRAQGQFAAPKAHRGIMMTAAAGWLNLIALGYFVAINAIANGCRLALRDSTPYDRHHQLRFAQRRRGSTNVLAESAARPPHWPRSRSALGSAISAWSERARRCASSSGPAALTR